MGAGRGWIATLDSLSSVLSVYDPAGRPLGTRRLDLAAGLVDPQFSGMGVAGRYLGLGMWTRVVSVEVTIDPSCAGRPPGR